MVHKNIKYGNVENVIVAEFGKGTISITNGKNDEHFSLFIKSKEYGPIGMVAGNEKDSDEFKPELVIAFHNLAGFNVFAEFVHNVWVDLKRSEIINPKDKE